eukprot:FR742212.1.p1 GENE.FR742212.1~~FR742212.1.p1  ORF type:complete len:261 (+),score=18.44 FR742212.1:128-910(+)
MSMGESKCLLQKRAFLTGTCILRFRVLVNFSKDAGCSLTQILAEVPFQPEMLVTRSGKQVPERRETCWMAETGIGGFVYSGKTMAPVPFTPAVRRLRDALYARQGIFYDCALLNLYPDGESACKYHADPGHGTYWAFDSVIVSFGETRRFCFRRPTEEEAHSFHLFDGDCAHMFGDCQDEFEHSVMKSENEDNAGIRASIVFKTSLALPSGRRGHGQGTSKGSRASTAGKPNGEKGGSGTTRGKKENTEDTTVLTTAAPP